MPQKVFVVVAVYQGILDDVTVCKHEKRAENVKKSWEAKYQIPSCLNTVGVYEETIDNKEE